VKYVYPACFYREADGRYSVEFADFELATFGDDLAEAMNMAADAVAGRIWLLLQDGEPLPPASDPKEIVPEDETGFVSLVYIDLDGRRPDGCAVTIDKTLAIPAWLVMAAERKSIDFAETLEDALIERLSAG
jgi:predicted RNase H-like HicB family nuclease